MDCKCDLSLAYKIVSPDLYLDQALLYRFQ